MELKKGVFYGVGVGPGDPELMTLKAVRILTECPVIAVPQTKSGETMALDIVRQVVPLEGKTILPLFFAMERGEAQKAAHREAAKAIAACLDEGKDVAMPNIGDVSVYSTYCYLMELLKEQGYETAMSAGVPSFCAVAARLGISLTTMNAPLHIIPAGGGNLEEALELPGTKVLMKSGRTLPKVAEALQEKGLLDKAAMVQDCGLPTEAVCADLSNLPEKTGYFATIIVKE